MTSLFNYTPEEREAAEALARAMTERGIVMTADDAQVMVNLANMVDAVIAENPKVLSTKATRVLAGNSALTQACLAVVARHVVQQHTLAYDDVNLRALSTLQMVVAVVAVLTQPPKLKHGTGG